MTIPFLHGFLARFVLMIGALSTRQASFYVTHGTPHEWVTIKVLFASEKRRESIQQKSLQENWYKKLVYTIRNVNTIYSAAEKLRLSVSSAHFFFSNYLTSPHSNVITVGTLTPMHSRIFIHCRI